jgi:hypothetical protein
MSALTTSICWDTTIIHIRLVIGATDDVDHRARERWPDGMVGGMGPTSWRTVGLHA